MWLKKKKNWREEGEGGGGKKKKQNGDGGDTDDDEHIVKHRQGSRWHTAKAVLWKAVVKHDRQCSRHGMDIWCSL